ncbi:MAG: bifunctional riboflavin kinase/FAD synthetase [Chloroflexi bacterium]|nr:bifunctional riboflavin kinase/FAD synthetase [Chloroflexota bacterium]
MEETETFIHVNDLREIETRQPTYLALGSFDGVHRGHQFVLQKMVTAAKDAGVRTAVLTFFPHPQRVLQNLTEPYYIATLADRVTWLAELGVDVIITQPFTEEVRQTRAADFIDQLCHYLDLCQLWGGDFALGYKREGDVPFLRQLGLQKGYTVELVNGMVTYKGELVSSSRIRRCLKAGEIEAVNGCLARPYRLHGTVVKGDQRGRTIGFPTANLDCWAEQLLPANGVYATYVWLGDERYKAATNVGLRPTVDGGRLTVEAHLLDFDGDIYGRELSLEFIGRVRSEKKFSGLAELKIQIQTDVQQIRTLL